MRLVHIQRCVKHSCLKHFQVALTPTCHSIHTTYEGKPAQMGVYFERKTQYSLVYFPFAPGVVARPIIRRVRAVKA